LARALKADIEVADDAPMILRLASLQFLWVVAPKTRGVSVCSCDHRETPVGTLGRRAIHFLLRKPNDARECRSQ
jgi:hypothetical protein